MSAQPRRTLPPRAYGSRHKQIRARLNQLVLAGGVRCEECGDVIGPGEEWDLGHVTGDPSRYRGALHVRCNRATNVPEVQQALVEEEQEPVGFGPKDDVWDVPWLRGLRRVPQQAQWPRLMTRPHERAVGSLGPSFIRWAERRSGAKLRWWQKLAVTRLLEIDSDGVLVWEAVILSLARQLGKSWLLRELALWRLHQGPRFKESQLILNTGSNLAVVREVQRPARVWAKGLSALYHVREVNGQEEIEYLEDSSRWMLRARESTYGYSASLAIVDEGWKVRPASVEEGLVPTMVERIEPQLLLVSTAHRLATALMLGRRKEALEHLGDSDGDLLIEWSARRDMALDDIEAWKLASPHWTPGRERLIRKRCEAMRAGEGEEDIEEPDPVESFRSQWLNVWPRKRVEPPGVVQPLLGDGLWAGLAEPLAASDAPIFVALEDDYGQGAAVAAACILDDGRIEVDGWTCETWDDAVLDVQRLSLHRKLRELHVGGSLMDRVPSNVGLPRARAAVSTNTRAGLALLRDLVATGGVVHDEATDELDEALAQAKVKQHVTGLFLIQHGPTHLLRALAWAVQAAHRPARVPGVH